MAVPTRQLRESGGRSKVATAHRPRLEVVALASTIALMAMLVVASGAGAAKPATALSNGSATPSRGDTSTWFAFSVDFSGVGGETASGVAALVGGQAVQLSLARGTAGKGTWAGTSTLPVGTWQVEFQSTSSRGTNPALVGPTVVVGAPTPTPTPTRQPVATIAPTPTPTLTERPTPLSGRTATPVPAAADPTPFGTIVIDSDASAAATVPGAAAASAGPVAQPSTQGSSRVPIEGIAAIGILGIVAFAAASSERRRRRAVAGGDRPGPGSDPRPAAAPDAAEAGESHGGDETVATIEFENPPEEAD